MRDFFGTRSEFHLTRKVKGRLTLESDLVALHTLNSLLKEVFVGGRGTGDIVLLPLYRGIDVLEDLLDRVGDLSADTVSGNLRVGDAVERTQGSVLQVYDEGIKFNSRA